MEKITNLETAENCVCVSIVDSMIIDVTRYYIRF